MFGLILNEDDGDLDLISECERLGIVHDCNERWEKGIPHHPEAMQVFEMLAISDTLFGGDYFEWKAGGDGDNGETLMYALSVLLELRDARNAEAS